MRKWVVLPLCLLVLSVLKAILSYKLNVIENDYWRVLLIFLMNAFGFGFVTIVLGPYVIKMLDKARKKGKKEAGPLGEYALLGSICLVLYLTFFVIYTKGPQTLLPTAWRNPADRNHSTIPVHIQTQAARDQHTRHLQSPSE